MTVIEFSLAGSAALAGAAGGRGALGAARARHRHRAAARATSRLGGRRRDVPGGPERRRRVCGRPARVGVLHIPGALTPTEVALAMSLGARS